MPQTYEDAMLNDHEARQQAALMFHALECGGLSEGLHTAPETSEDEEDN